MYNQAFLILPYLGPVKEPFPVGKQREKFSNCKKFFDFDTMFINYITFELNFCFISFNAVCNVTSIILVSVEMKKIGVSQGLAYQQPMDDSGQEHHPMLLNDGREVPKFPPDKTTFGK